MSAGLGRAPLALHPLLQSVADQGETDDQGGNGQAWEGRQPPGVEHDAVADVACIGVPHAEMGEELKALIILEHPDALPDPAEMLNWVRDRLSHYKCPRSVEYVGSIGRNTMGKVNKRKLRAPYWEGVERA